jgi:hypothetical protein
LLQQAIELIDTRASALGQFYEATLTTNWQETVSSVVDGLTQVGDERPPVHGFKLRCGGLEAAAFPSVEQVAYALAECRDKRVPFKATAGLHHPIRRFDASVQCMMHGFLNVFGAGFLAGARNLSRQELGGILADENPQNFAIEQDHFRWKSVRASTDEVSAARKHALISFGSCSFDEPRDDLRSMGWL